MKHLEGFPTQLQPAWLQLPALLEQRLWQHASASVPNECVGVLGGKVSHIATEISGWQATTLYPLQNVAADPEREYLADAAGFLRALKAIRAQQLELVAIYHSHPCGPATFSRTDQSSAAYEVPYLIADVRSGSLKAYLLPQGQPCVIR